MNCGCTKDLGCFTTCQIIDFGFVNDGIGDYDYIFQVWSNGGYYEITKEIASGSQVMLPFQFNENGETMIKIKLPVALQGSGVYYATTKDGACCFVVHGVPAGCATLPTCP